MRAIAAQLVRLLCAVAFLTGVTLDGACAAAMAAHAEPMPSSQAKMGHAHDCGMDTAPDSEDPNSPDHMPAKLICCHALGSVASAIPSAPVQLTPPPLARTVRYWASTVHPAGRAIVPALGPPRPI